MRPSTAGGERVPSSSERSSSVVAAGGENPAPVPLPLPPPPPPPPPVASARSFNLRAPGGTLARLTLHGPPDGLPLTPGATLRGTLDLRPSQQRAPEPSSPANGGAAAAAADGDGKAEREKAPPPPPPPICARFAVALESVEAVASKWAIRGPAAAAAATPASRRVAAADEAAAACAHLRLAHFELSVPPDAAFVSGDAAGQRAVGAAAGDGGVARLRRRVVFFGGRRRRRGRRRRGRRQRRERRSDGDGDKGGGLWARSPSSSTAARGAREPRLPASEKATWPPPPLLEWELPIAVVAAALTSDRPARDSQTSASPRFVTTTKSKI